MNDGRSLLKDPVKPWIPPAVPRRVSRVVERRARPCGVVAGWIFSGAVGLITGAGYGLAIGSGPGGLTALFLTVGHYLGLFALPVVLVVSILAMTRGAVWRGILLLTGAPVMVGAMAFAGGWAGAGWREWRRAAAPVPARAAEGEGFSRETLKRPSDGVAVNAAASALLADAMLADARKLLTVKSEAVYAAGKNDAFARAAREPRLSEKDREALREALRAMYRDADKRRNLK